MSKLQTRVGRLEKTAQNAGGSEDAKRDAFVRQELDRYLGIASDTIEERRVGPSVRRVDDRSTINNPEVRQMLDDYLAMIHADPTGR